MSFFYTVFGQCGVAGMSSTADLPLSFSTIFIALEVVHLPCKYRAFFEK